MEEEKSGVDSLQTEQSATALISIWQECFFLLNL